MVKVRRRGTWGITTETSGRWAGKRVLIRPDGRHMPVMTPRDLEDVQRELNLLTSELNDAWFRLAAIEAGNETRDR